MFHVEHSGDPVLGQICLLRQMFHVEQFEDEPWLSCVALPMFHVEHFAVLDSVWRTEEEGYEENFSRSLRV